jgi:hypothetical protein
VEQRLRQATQFANSTVDVAPAALGNDAGIVGAACIALAACSAFEPVTLQPAR